MTTLEDMIRTRAEARAHHEIEEAASAVQRHLTSRHPSCNQASDAVKAAMEPSRQRRIEQFEDEIKEQLLALSSSSDVLRDIDAILQGKVERLRGKPELQRFFYGVVNHESID